jgi:hypothetical protein
LLFVTWWGSYGKDAGKHGIIPVLPELILGEPLKTAPKIDGTLDDPLWKSATTADLAKHMDGSDGAGKARLYIAQDENALYVAIECFESETALKSLKAEATADNLDKMWGDDECELFLDPSNHRDSYYQIAINSKGIHWDAYQDLPNVPDRKWKPDCKMVTGIGKESWIVTLSIPWTAFNRTEHIKTEWAANFLVTRSAANVHLYWSPIRDNSAHRPEKFGILKGVRCNTAKQK